MGKENTTKQSWGVTVAPPSREARPCAAETKGGTEGDLGGGQRSGCGMVTGDGKGLAGRQADNTGGGLGGGWTSPRGGQRTESRVETTEGGAMEETGGTRVDQTEGGAREKTGETRSRRSQAGPRPQP